MSARHRIAIVDDDHSVRKALCRLLRSADLDASAYASGREFLDALQNAVPDCLLLDLRMPDMSGLELQRHLTGIGMALPTIIMTGHDEPGLRADCLAAGARNYFRKPLDDRALLEAIDAAIAHALSNREP
jgi:FixJ family two-component response regulator